MLLPGVCEGPVMDALCIRKSWAVAEFLTFFSVWMQPLEEASKYFLKQGIPFPKVHLSEEEKKNLKECYIFEDTETPEAPTVVFFPLVNDTFRKYKEPGKLWDRDGPLATWSPFGCVRMGDMVKHGPLPPLLWLPWERNVGVKVARSNIVPQLESGTWDHIYTPSMTFLYLSGVERSPAEMAQGNVDVSSIFSPYCLNSFTYAEEEFDKLVDLTSYNIQNNKHLILQALNSAIEQKRQQKK